MRRLLKDLATFTFSLIEMSLALRFLLKLLAADPRSGFVSFVYESTHTLLEPFYFAFPTPSVSGAHVIEFTTLFAMFVYAFVGYVLLEFLEIISASSRKRK